MILIYFIFTFTIAILLSCSEVLFGKYKLNYLLLLRSPKYLILYGLYYGLASVIILFLLSYYELEINNLRINENPIITSFVVGVSIKSFSRISLYTINTGDREIYIGLKQISNFFDDLALKRINDVVDDKIIDETNRMLRVLANYSDREIEDRIELSLPSNYSKYKKQLFMKDIKAQTSRFEKIRLFILRFGYQKIKTLKKFT